MRTSDKELERLLSETFGDATRFDASQLFETLIEEGTIDSAAPRVSASLKARLWLSARCSSSATTSISVAAVLVALLIAISFLTPVDNAVARWVGQVFNIGERGGSPTLTGRDSRGGPWNQAQNDPLVLGVWHDRDGTRNEIVGWKARKQQLCFAADVPSRTMTGWFCVEDSPPIAPVQAASIRADRSRSSDGIPTMTTTLLGRVDARVVEIRLLGRGGSKPSKARAVRPMRVTADLAGRLGSAPSPFGLFLATVDSTDAVLIEGLAVDGRRVGAASISLASHLEEEGTSPIISADSPTNDKIKEGGR